MDYLKQVFDELTKSDSSIDESISKSMATISKIKSIKDSTLKTNSFYKNVSELGIDNDIIEIAYDIYMKLDSKSDILQSNCKLKKNFIYGCLYIAMKIKLNNANKLAIDDQSTNSNFINILKCKNILDSNYKFNSKKKTRIINHITTIIPDLSKYIINSISIKNIVLDLIMSLSIDIVNVDGIIKQFNNVKSIIYSLEKTTQPISIASGFILYYVNLKKLPINIIKISSTSGVSVGTIKKIEQILRT